MSNGRLTITEVSLLLALMAEAREISNPELKARYGLSLDGAPRRKLNDLKLVESAKRGRAFGHQLTDAGWARCKEELLAEVPPRSGVAGGALYAVLGGLQRYLDNAELSLSDVFRRGGGGQRHDGQSDDLESDIRDAYRRLARRPGAWVSLGDLRLALSNVPRSEMDATLLRMGKKRGVTLVPEDNQKTLTARNRDAAISIPGGDLHFIAIEV